HQRQAGARVPIFSEVGRISREKMRPWPSRSISGGSCGSVVNTAGREYSTQPGTISRPAGPYGTSAAENCEHRAETQARAIPLEAVCFDLMTPTRHSSVLKLAAAPFSGGIEAPRSPGASDGGRNRSAALSQADGCKAFALAARPHDDGVAVFEEAAPPPGAHSAGPPPAGRDLEQAAEPVVPRRRDRARAE